MLVIVIVLEGLLVEYEHEHEYEKSKRKRKRKRKRWSHAHYLVPAIDIDDLASNGRSAIAGEKNPGIA